MDKSRLFAAAKHLKDYNKDRYSKRMQVPEKERSSKFQNVYITDHLPKELISQRKRLYPQFKEAKRNNNKAYWRISGAPRIL